MVTTGAAISISFPVVPLEGWNRVCGDPANGTGMSAFHVNLPRHQAEYLMLSVRALSHGS
jgi:hypothetical protein